MYIFLRWKKVFITQSVWQLKIHSAHCGLASTLFMLLEMIEQGLSRVKPCHEPQFSSVIYGVLGKVLWWHPKKFDCEILNKKGCTWSLGTTIKLLLIEPWILLITQESRSDVCSHSHSPTWPCDLATLSFSPVWALVSSFVKLGHILNDVSEFRFLLHVWHLANT